MSQNFSTILLFLPFFLLPFSAWDECGAGKAFAAQPAQQACRQAEGLMRQAFDLAKGEGQHSAALSKSNEALDQCPQSAALWFNRGMLRYQLGEATATDDLRQAIELRPGFARAYNSLAAILLKRGGDSNVAQARLYARQARILDANNGEISDTLIEAEETSLKVDSAPKTGLSNRGGLAIVIGNRNYSDRAIPNVEFAVNDAQAVRDYLINTFGFPRDNILFFEDASLSTMRSLFGVPELRITGELYRRTQKGLSQIVIYYSGHGAPDQQTNESYLLPVDAKPSSVAATGLSLDSVRKSLDLIRDDKQPQSITLIVDACFSGSSPGGNLVRDVSSIGLRPKVPDFTGSATAFIASSASDQTSWWDRENKHGLFTYHLLDTIKEKALLESQVSIADLRERLVNSEVVAQRAQRLHNQPQTPRVSGDETIILLRGRSHL